MSKTNLGTSNPKPRSPELIMTLTVRSPPDLKSRRSPRAHTSTPKSQLSDSRTQTSEFTCRAQVLEVRALNSDPKFTTSCLKLRPQASDDKQRWQPHSPKLRSPNSNSDPQTKNPNSDPKPQPTNLRPPSFNLTSPKSSPKFRPLC